MNSLEEYLNEVEALIAHTLPTQIKARACHDVPVLLALVRRYREALEHIKTERTNPERGDVVADQMAQCAEAALQFDPRKELQKDGGGAG